MITRKSNPESEEMDLSVQNLAHELATAFEHKKRNDGTPFICLKDGSPKWMTEVIHAVHGDKLPDDTVYSMIKTCAEALAECETTDELQNAVYDIEADIYTHDLTAWLHARTDHIEYLTEAMAESSPASGWDLLYAAQKLQIEEVGNALLAELEKIVEERIQP